MHNGTYAHKKADGLYEYGFLKDNYKCLENYLGMYFSCHYWLYTGTELIPKGTASIMEEAQQLVKGL